MSSNNGENCEDYLNKNFETKSVKPIEKTDLNSHTHKGQNECIVYTQKDLKIDSYKKNKTNLRKTDAEIEKENQQRKRQKRKQARKKKMKSQPSEKIDLKQGCLCYFIYLYNVCLRTSDVYLNLNYSIRV